MEWKKIVFALAVALVFAGIMAQGWAYVAPTRNLVIVEVGADGTPIEKKVAENANLFFSREMKTTALFDVGGISGYRAVFTLNLKNVSGGALDNISLIETIPKEIAADSSRIESGENITVLEDDPVIKFSLGTILKEGIKRVSYAVRFEAEATEEIEGIYREMGIPTALIPISEGDCTGIQCNDFNPCTTDYCSMGQCVYANVAEGMSCGEGRACVQGSCQEFRNADIILAAGIVIIVIVALSTLLAFKRKAHRM